MKYILNYCTITEELTVDVTDQVDEEILQHFNETGELPESILSSLDGVLVDYELDVAS